MKKRQKKKEIKKLCPQLEKLKIKFDVKKFWRWLLKANTTSNTLSNPKADEGLASSKIYPVGSPCRSSNIHSQSVHKQVLA